VKVPGVPTAVTLAPISTFRVTELVIFPDRMALVAGGAGFAAQSGTEQSSREVSRKSPVKRDKETTRRVFI
jgi:hypothetical protein